MCIPELERLLGLLADVPVELRPEFLERECPDAAVRDRIAALLRDAEEAESYFDSIIRGVPASRRNSQRKLRDR
jgi:hypothetical protein